MKELLLMLSLAATTASAQIPDTMHTYTYLAIGDSYTIGEAVPLRESFPYQTVQLLRNRGYSVAAPEILAQTGWTTDELTAAMNAYSFLPRYDLVTLLIGVNNQYRGREALPFKEELETLMKRAIELANGRTDHVVLLSIPNYGLTPYAAALDREKIAHDLDVFNGIIKALAVQYRVQFIDIGPDFDEAKTNAGLVASDGLHPSSQAYERWAQRASAAFSSVLK